MLPFCHLGGLAPGNSCRGGNKNAALFAPSPAQNCRCSKNKNSQNQEKGKISLCSLTSEPSNFSRVVSRKTSSSSSGIIIKGRAMAAFPGPWRRPVGSSSGIISIGVKQDMLAPRQLDIPFWWDRVVVESHPGLVTPVPPSQETSRGTSIAGSRFLQTTSPAHLRVAPPAQSSVDAQSTLAADVARPCSG